jgi:hypothetical protein
MAFTAQYSGSAEDLIAASIVTREMITDKKTGQIYTRGSRTRRDSAGGKIWVRHLKYEIVVDFFEALERGIELPGVTGEIIAAAKSETDAQWKDYEARCARHATDADDEPDPNSVDCRVGYEIGTLMAIAEDDATAEDLIALMPEFKAKLLARKAKRDAERKRPGFLRLVVDNEVRT